MTRKIQILSIVILIFSAIFIQINTLYPISTSKEQSIIPAAGFVVPKFSLTDQNGINFTSDSFYGKVTIINFWASWCPPCKAEMPALQQIFKEFNNEQVVLVAINTTYQDSVTNALDFTAAYNLSFPILFDKDGTVSRQYQVKSMPTTFFVREDGIIDEVVVGGPLSQAFLKSKIQQLLSGNP